MKQCITSRTEYAGCRKYWNAGYRVHVHANGDGLWEARLEFPEAPVGVTFTVVVWSPEAEAEFAFPFTRLGGE